MDDREALAQFAATGSNEAFARLVDQHVDLVYSVARRALSDPHAADDATQAVFIILAGKARSLPSRVLLSSWLFRTTVYVCRNARRIAARRNAHERKAALMHSEIVNPSAPPVWEQLSPILNEAVESLGRSDRDAILLRYFERKEVAEIGALLGISEAAARKRLSRAVERLGEFFRSRGIDAPVAAIDAGLLAGAIIAAPHAVRTAAAASALGASSTSTTSAGALTLAKGALLVTAKTKLAAIAALVLLLIGSTTAIVLIVTSKNETTTTTISSTVMTTSSTGPTENVIKVGAYIDGRSQLRIRGNTAQWHHLEFIVPGKFGGGERPTLIDGQRWMPKWPKELETDLYTDSDTFNRIASPLPRAAVEATIRQLKGNGLVSVIQQPTESNDYTLVVEFDDHDHPGASDYVAEIHFPSTPAPVSADASPWKKTTPSGASGEVVAVSAMPDSAPPGEDRSWAQIAMDKLTGSSPAMHQGPGTRPTKADVQWWKPDGTPLPGGSFATTDSVFLNSQNVYRFVLNFSGPDELAVNFRIDNGGRSWGTSGSPMGPGKRQYVIYSQLKPGTSAFSFKVGCAGGQWKTLVQSETPASEVTAKAPGERVVFTALEQVGADVAFKTVRRGNTNADSRVVAIVNGKQVPADSRGSNGNNGVNTSNYVIPNVQISDVQRLELQTRPFNEWMEFKNITVQPKPASPQAEASAK